MNLRPERSRKEVELWLSGPMRKGESALLPQKYFRSDRLSMGSRQTARSWNLSITGGNATNQSSEGKNEELTTLSGWKIVHWDSFGRIWRRGCGKRGRDAGLGRRGAYGFPSFASGSGYIDQAASGGALCWKLLARHSRCLLVFGGRLICKLWCSVRCYATLQESPACLMSSETFECSLCSIGNADSPLLQAMGAWEWNLRCAMIGWTFRSHDIGKSSKIWSVSMHLSA